MKLYVGNLPFDMSEADVRKLFDGHGNLDSVSLVTDSATGRFRGFAFVEMNDSDATKAIAALNGQDVGGRALNVNEARPKSSSGGGWNKGRDGGGGGGRSGGGGGRGRW
jgi:cold-inducible RNA-binding protein